MSLAIAHEAQALIFDLDGTLADTMPVHYQAWCEVAGHHGFSFPEKWFYELAGVPTQQIARLVNERFGLDLDPVAIEAEKESAYIEKANGIVKPISPVVKLVFDAFGKIPLACGTGNIRSIALMTLKAIGLADAFPVLVTAEDVTHPKPAPDTFLACAKQMGVAPQFCQVFEDGEPGLQAARAAKMIATDVRPYLRM